MPYVGADGSVGGSKSFAKTVTDFFASIYTLVVLFFTTITNPAAIESHSSSSTRTYATRNQGRSCRSGGQSLGGGRGGNTSSARPRSNIRGVGDLQGDAKCAIGGG